MSADKLFFFSRSKNVAPGKGANECVQNTEQYHELSKIPHWRQQLSNFSEHGTFEYNGLKYKTIEHAFQGSKIAIVDPEVGKWFSIDSGHNIGQSPGLVARKNRKLRRLSAPQLHHWDRIKASVIQNITEAKLSQCPDYRTLLSQTQNAQLWHIQIRQKPVRCQYLELLRESVIKK